MTKRGLRGLFSKKKSREIHPDEIFLDSSNIQNFNRDQFEGRLEKPIPQKSLFFIGAFFFLVLMVFGAKASSLQIINSAKYKEISENNRLRHDVIFAHRGVIKDRNDVTLAWNEFKEGRDFPVRMYTDKLGFSNILGYIKYPQKDTSGFYYTTQTIGQDGIEKYYDKELSGKNGIKLTEVDVKGEVASDSDILPPQNGEELHLSIDARVQEVLADYLKKAVEASGFEGGAGVIMNIKTGEVLASVSYPEYDSEIMTEGKDSAAIKALFENKRKPFLERVSGGLYAPGSIVKPFVGLAVLQENIITPTKEIQSTGSISIPNPYDKDKVTIFKDWKAHGYTNLREAIAVSSDVYFYSVGGGYKDQKGLGIAKIDEYVKKFLLGVKTEGFFDGPTGNVPTPEWKEKTFGGEKWVLGNTYHTSIGQYGFLVTPLQMARAVGGIARSGVIVEPTILKGERGNTTIVSGIDEKNYKEVRLGMQDAVEWGTAIALNIPAVSVGAKTGTAEVGAKKEYVNSWIEGFFPFENPEYSFAVVLERGPPKYQISSMRVMGDTLRWMVVNTPEYTGGEKADEEEIEKMEVKEGVGDGR